MNQSQKEAVIKTLCYADVFDYPLTYEEIKKWLIEFRDQNSEIRIQKNNLIRRKGNYYFLPGREEIIVERLKREKWSKEKFKAAERNVKILQIIPSVKLIGVTGALAMENAKKDDDIDLFIITSKGLLWTSRFLVTILLELTGKRRRPEVKRVNNKICLNMFATEECLQVPHKEQDLFSAHEVLQMKPIFNRDNTYQKFLMANKWVREYLPNAIKLDTEILRYKNIRGRNNKAFNILISNYLNIVEKLFKFFQLRYMRKRRTTEIITDGLIRFHPHDARNWILEKFRLRFSQALASA